MLKTTRKSDACDDWMAASSKQELCLSFTFAKYFFAKNQTYSCQFYLNSRVSIISYCLSVPICWKTEVESDSCGAVCSLQLDSITLVRLLLHRSRMLLRFLCCCSQTDRALGICVILACNNTGLERFESEAAMFAQSLWRWPRCSGPADEWREPLSKPREGNQLC